MPKKAAAKKKGGAKKAAAKKAAQPAPGYTLLASADAVTGPFPGIPVSSSSPAAVDPGELLLVCIQDPYLAPGQTSLTANITVPAYDGQQNHRWKLTAVLEAHPPRFLEGYATAGSFELDLRVTAAVASGAWGGSARITSRPRVCRLVILRDQKNKVHFSVDGGVYHIAEEPMPKPERSRWLNADVAFQGNGDGAVSVAATAVISQEPWALLTAGSSAVVKGLAYDSKWRNNLKEGDGATLAIGSYAFAVMDRAAYAAHCTSRGLRQHII